MNYKKINKFLILYIIYVIFVFARWQMTHKLVFYPDTFLPIELGMFLYVDNVNLSIIVLSLSHIAIFITYTFIYRRQIKLPYKGRCQLLSCHWSCFLFVQDGSII